MKQEEEQRKKAGEKIIEDEKKAKAKTIKEYEKENV